MICHQEVTLSNIWSMSSQIFFYACNRILKYAFPTMWLQSALLFHPKICFVHLLSTKIFRAEGEIGTKIIRAFISHWKCDRLDSILPRTSTDIPQATSRSMQFKGNAKSRLPNKCLVYPMCSCYFIYLNLHFSNWFFFVHFYFPGFFFLFKLHMHIF